MKEESPVSDQMSRWRPGCSRRSDHSSAAFFFSREEEKRRRKRGRVRTKGVRRKMSRSGSLPSSPLSNDTLYPSLPSLHPQLEPPSRLASGDMASTHRRHNRNLIPVASPMKRSERKQATRLFIKPLISLDTRIFLWHLPLLRVSLYTQLLFPPLLFFLSLVGCCAPSRSSRRESRTLKQLQWPEKSLEKFDKFGARGSFSLSCYSIA